MMTGTKVLSQLSLTITVKAFFPTPPPPTPIKKCQVSNNTNNNKKKKFLEAGKEGCSFPAFQLSLFKLTYY